MSFVETTYDYWTEVQKEEDDFIYAMPRFWSYRRGCVVLQGLPWGELALSIAHEVSLQFGGEMTVRAFKATDCGHIYVNLDKPLDEHWRATNDEFHRFSRESQKKLDKVAALGEIPNDLLMRCIAGLKLMITLNSKTEYWDSPDEETDVEETFHDEKADQEKNNSLRYFDEVYEEEKEFMDVEPKVGCFCVAQILFSCNIDLFNLQSHINTVW